MLFLDHLLFRKECVSVDRNRFSIAMDKFDGSPAEKGLIHSIFEEPFRLTSTITRRQSNFAQNIHREIVFHLREIVPL